MLPVAFLVAIMALSSAVNSGATRSEMPFAKPTLDCGGKLAYGLTKEECHYMSSIGMAAQGLNGQSQSDDAYIWIGDQGPNKFTFTNAGNSPVTLIIWLSFVGENKTRFMNRWAPQVSYSLPKQGDKVTVCGESRIWRLVCPR